MCNFQYTWCEKMLPEYIKLFPEMKDDYFVLRVSHLAKVQGVAAAFKLIDSEISPESDDALILKLGVGQQVWKEVLNYYLVVL